MPDCNIEPRLEVSYLFDVGLILVCLIPEAVCVKCSRETDAEVDNVYGTVLRNKPEEEEWQGEDHQGIRR